MDDEEKIDLSPLDPSRDRGHWQEMIARTTRLALAADRHPVSVLQQLQAWWRPALAVAAVASAIVWTGALLDGGTPALSTTSDPAYTLASWASEDSLPSTAQIIRTLGADHE